MRRFFVAILIVWLVMPADGDEKKTIPAAPPEQQVLALVNRVQNDLLPEKRAVAAEVLHQYDGNNFPEIMPVLVQVLERDTDPTVRKEAAKSLGRLKPPSSEALDALHRAAEKDASLKVRMAAKVAKLGYKAPPSPPTAPLPQAPKEKWTDKLTFWKKKTSGSVDEVTTPVQGPQQLKQLPKPASSSQEGLLLLPPPPQK